MVSFNTIDCAQFSYRLVWQERHYLLKLALIPLCIKFLFFMISVFYGEPGNIIRLSLFMIPAYFAEGWMLCHFVRLITIGQRWPYQMTGDEAKDMKAARMRGKPLLAGIVGFVLINLGMAFYFSTLTSLVPPEVMRGEEFDPSQLPQSTAILMTLMMAFIFVVFRFVWLYIPLAAGMNPKNYVMKTHGLGFTIRLIGLWLICFVPAMFAMQFIGSLFVVDGAEGNAINQVVLSILRITFDTIKNLIVTGGVTFAILQLIRARQIGKDN